jgi:spore photoproduct lyase
MEVFKLHPMEYAGSKTAAAAGPLAFRLHEQDKQWLLYLEHHLQFSHQQLKFVVEWLVDTRMWQEPDFEALLKRVVFASGNQIEKTVTQRRETVFASFLDCYKSIQRKEKQYTPAPHPEDLPGYIKREKQLKGRIFRTCQAYSEKGVCCNLRVLNIVDNCAMDCAYCILQNHYNESVVTFPTNLEERLAALDIPPGKRMRVGTGQHTDSLLWGNRNNLLADLFKFAENHAGIILELKTKSRNVAWLLENPVPRNVCCSWTLNSPVVIANEEHGTAGLKGRLEAARQVADKGVKVGFHLHPMIYYKGWARDYREIIERVLNLFRPQEVLWFSLGTITLYRELERALRVSFRRSKVLQMEREITPDKKITYHHRVRRRLYENALTALSPWRDKVAIYFCMEFDKMWRELMGHGFEDNDGLNRAINSSAFAKL